MYKKIYIDIGRYKYSDILGEKISKNIQIKKYMDREIYIKRYI